jgi:hypothetical protein
MQHALLSCTPTALAVDLIGYEQARVLCLVCDRVDWQRMRDGVDWVGAQVVVVESAEQHHHQQSTARSHDVLGALIGD